MQKKNISYSKTGRFSDLINDYLSQKDELKDFYLKFPTEKNLKAQADSKIKEYSKKNRLVLAEELKNQYLNIDRSAAVNKNIKLIEKSNSVTVTTGHQLSLLTGPLYFIIKIISVIKLCIKLNSLYSKINFIPIYWMASEDHDFEEISSFNYKNKKIQWKTDKKGAVGDLDLRELQSVLDSFQEKLPKNKNSIEIVEIIKNSYKSSRNLAEATRKLVNILFREYGLIIVDGNSRSLKQLFIEPMKSDLLYHNCNKYVNDQISSIKKSYNSKFKPQVDPRLINLFYFDQNGRHRIKKDMNEYFFGENETKMTSETMINEIEKFPEKFSPNVLLRPLYQEIILPNICYVGGGGEIAYWLQLKKFFKNQKVLFPVLLLRNSLLLMSSKSSIKLNKLTVTDSELFLSKNDLINKKVKNFSKIKIDLRSLKEQLNTQFEYLESIVKKTDPSFEGAVAAQNKKQIKVILNLEKRLLKAQKAILQDKVERISNIHEVLFPENQLQERSVNFFQFYEEIGSELIPFLIKNIDPLDLNFTILEY
jgi:bacillithiol biosynthesis cysteine-adding enzyme BshC